MKVGINGFGRIGRVFFREGFDKLDIAGIMSSKPGLVVAEKYKMLNFKAKEIGTNLKAPFMTLSFMALLVIPEIKIGDKYLFDVSKFEPISLFDK